MEFIFTGNRFFVLEEMFNNDLNIKKIFAVKNSYLEKELQKRNIGFTSLMSKKQLITYLINEYFDIFIANGCPYILPIKQIRESNPQKKMLNIHPSYLPDLRGADPQPGAILFGRDSGATCHEMDDGIDTGRIVEQVKIPNTKDLDVRLLYQLTFNAEKEVFVKSLHRNFKALKEQNSQNDLIYYTFKEEDREFNLEDELDIVNRKVKAFNNKSKGAYFKIDDRKVFVWSIRAVENEYLKKISLNVGNSTVIFLYEDIMVIKNWNDVFIIKYSNPSNVELKINQRI